MKISARLEAAATAAAAAAVTAAVATTTATTSVVNTAAAAAAGAVGATAAMDGGPLPDFACVRVQLGDLHMHIKNRRHSGDRWKGLLKAESFSTIN
jgi:hypothetical protein